MPSPFVQKKCPDFSALKKVKSKAWGRSRNRKETGLVRAKGSKHP